MAAAEQDGQLEIVPEEVSILHRMRTLLLEKRSWRGVPTAPNREGYRTRGWEPVERDGRVVRKGHASRSGRRFQPNGCCSSP